MAAMVCVAATPFTFAQETEWTGAIDNDFATAGNWTDGVPGTGDLAEFRNDGTTVTVDFSADATFGGIRLLGTSEPVVVFELNGNTVNLDLTGTSAFLSSANSSNISRTLTVRNGDFNMPGFQIHGLTSGWRNPVIFNLEQGTTLASVNSSRIGSTGGAEMYINGGSTWTHDAELVFAYASHGSWPSFGSSGLLEISGAGSSATVTASHTVILGRGGYGELNILAGGQFTAGTMHTATATADNSGADILVDGSGSLLTISSTLFLAGTGTAAFNPASLTVQAQGVANLAAFHSWENGTTLLKGGTINVNGTAEFDSGSVLSFTLYTPGQTASFFADDLIIDTAALEILIDDTLTPDISQTFLLAEYSESISGTFAGLSEGATFTVGDTVFQISYLMGLDNNTIGLTVIPEPTTITALLGALALAVAMRRRK